MKLIMFDIDGTLVDSYGFDEECYLKAAETVLGIKISSNWDEYEHATDSGILNEAIDRYKIPGDKFKIKQKFKNVFIGLVSEFIEKNPKCVNEIEGANSFIQYLLKKSDCRVSIATGGWEETAKLKLHATGIDINGCAFASSSDYRARVEIMRAAESKASDGKTFKSKTYFGDGSWDKEASDLLNYRFILVGNRLEHKNQISSFKEIESIAEMINL